MKLDTAPGAARVRTVQRGLLRLSFEPRGGKTVLAERYASAPFGAVRANYPDDSGMPEVQITNPSGGILGGDRLELAVSLASGASATVLTQAANKAYRGNESTQRADLWVGEGAFLEYLPHHLIPYAGSYYHQQTTFHLAPDATLLTWDAFAAGRVARGERFAFDALRAKTTILRDGIPEAIDGFDLAGGSEHFGGYSYVAAVYVSTPAPLETLADELHAALNGSPGALASASAPSAGLCFARVLTDSAHELYTLLNLTRRMARDFLDLVAPERGVF